MARILGIRDSTLENLAKLKLATMNGDGFETDFVIELEHKPCCCCIAVSIIFQSFGLSICSTYQLTRYSF